MPSATTDSPAPMPPPVSAPVSVRHSAISDLVILDLHDSTANNNLPSINEHANLAATRARVYVDQHEVDPLTIVPPTPMPVLGSPQSNPADIPSSPSVSPPTATARRQSLLPNRQTSLIRTLLQAVQAQDDLTTVESLHPINANMVTRKIWVKRPHGSATLITVNEDDLVDDVRDLILRKYANSLGRQFDAPDLTIRITPREQRQDRTLGPEEPISRTLDAYFPGGQTVDEALTIDIPHRRTPKPSPRANIPHAVNTYYTEDGRPSENGEGYFPPVPALPSPHLLTNAAVTVPTHSIAVLATGQIPSIPPPGGTRSRAYRERPERPRLGRTHTSSPTILGPLPTASIAATTSSAHGMLPNSPCLSQEPQILTC
jgi:osomolarity two-component system, response regulator SSK1